MKDLTLSTLVAVFEEMFGFGLFWFLVFFAAVVIAGYLYVLIRDRTMSMKKFLWAQLSMPFGAIAAILFVLWITNSKLSDLGGPIDLIVFLAIGTMGAIGISILVYTVESIFWPMEKRAHRKGI